MDSVNDLELMMLLGYLLYYGFPVICLVLGIDMLAALMRTDGQPGRREKGVIRKRYG